MKMKKLKCTWVPVLKSLHQKCPVNTRQKNNSQEHSFENTQEARKYSEKNVVEEKEVGHDGEEPPGK